MRAILLAVLLALGVAPAVLGQTMGRITGTVTDAAGDPLGGINVYLEGSTLGAASNAEGAYQIGSVPAGRYTLVASGIGYKAQRRDVSVATGATVIADFTFDETNLLLPEVEVIGRRQTTYTSAYTFAATKTATAPLDVPQALSTVTKELIDDQQAFALPDVMKNVSGVHQNTASNDLSVRGFRNHTGPSASGYRLINGLRGGFGYFTNPLLINVERVEVLKGPGAALYGAINPGGMVNLVTKKPLAETRRAVSFGAGSFNTLRASLDATGPLNQARTLLFRINVGFEETDTFRDFNNHTAFAIAPTVTFIPTDRTTLNAELVYSSFNGFLNRGVAVPAQNLDDIDIAQSLSQPSDGYTVSDVYLNASLNHRLTDGLSLNLAYLRFAWDEDLAEHRTLNRWRDNGTQLVSNLRYWERLVRTQTDNVTAYLTARGRTGGIGHTLVAGADWIRFDTDGGTVWEARFKRVPVEREVTTASGETITVTEIVEQPLTFDLRNPVYRHRGNDIANYVFRKNRDVGDREETYRTVGVYVQDQVEVTARLKALVGLRYEFYRTVRDYTLPDEAGAQNQGIFVPRFGLVAGLTETVNLYGQFTRGFVPVGPVFLFQPEQYRPDGDTTPYDHETSRSFEVGAKGAFLDGDLVATLALFQIVKANVLQPTGAVNTFGNDVLEQLGEVKSQGVEVEVVGRPLPALSVNAHYTYNPTEIVETDDAAQQGLSLWGAPEHRTGLWAKYVIEQGALRGVGLGVGFQRVSSRRHRFVSTDLQTREQFFARWPAYTVLDAAVYYTLNRFKLAVNFDNVFDTRYWVGGFDFLQAYPGTPFRATATVGYTF